MDLLKTFFEKDRWVTAIEIARQKEIDTSLLRKLLTPEYRLELYRMIRDGKYTIEPPHEAQIPKDDGTFRTVYVNEPLDRVLLSIYNDMIFELCSDMVHPTCTSYQKGIGCGKVVTKVSKTIRHMKPGVIGKKVDLSKYFDSVPIRYIDEIFDRIDNTLGKSAITDTVRRYYHTNTVIDINKNTIEKYSSLRQGCAFAAFLADAVLYDIDDAISALDVCYVRYSDDILIIGDEWEKGYKILKQALSEKTLILNPKKVETLYKDKWFKFLGFTLRNNKISLSKPRIKSFQKEIEDRTIRSATTNIDEIIRSVNDYLYIGDGKYSWTTSVLPIINVKRDIQTLDNFVMDAIRAGSTERTRIGGLGCVTDGDYTIKRGTGRNVKANKLRYPYLNRYQRMTCMKTAFVINRDVYEQVILSTL